MSHSEVLRYVEENESRYVAELQEAISLRTVSGDEEESVKALQWVRSRLEALGACVELCEELGALMAAVQGHETSNTLLVYGHMDVLPPDDRVWGDQDPFAMLEKTGTLYGQGVTHSKGPLLCWIYALQAMLASGQRLPVNVKLLVDTRKECGSGELREELHAKHRAFLEDVTSVCLCGSRGLKAARPSIVYALRGHCLFRLSVASACRDLHSGHFGGTVYEPMTDLNTLLGSLVDARGDILVDGISDGVTPASFAEDKYSRGVTFDVEEIRREAGVTRLLHDEDRRQLIRHRTQLPCLSIHGVDTGAGVSPHVVPACAVAHFSLRIVPHQNPDRVAVAIGRHISKLFTKLESNNNLSLSMPVFARPWLATLETPLCMAARKAVRRVYHQEAEMVREGGTVSVAADLQEITHADMLLLPVGYGDQVGRDSLERKEFMNGIKLVVVFMAEIAALNMNVG